MVGKLIAASPRDESLSESIAELVKLGPRGLEELVARFPGPMWRDPRAETYDLPQANEIGPLPLALTCFGPAVQPVLLGLLDSPDPEDRLCAAAIAPGFLSDGVLQGLVELALHGDPDARRMALRALAPRVTENENRNVLRVLRAVWGSKEERTPRRMRALAALAQLGDAKMVPQLVSLLGNGPSQDFEDAVNDALVLLTGQDFGEQAMLWRMWFARHGKESRAAWLLDGLTSLRETPRRRSLAALSSMLRRPFDEALALDRKACKALAADLALELGV